MSIAARCTCDRKGSGFGEDDGYCPRHSPRRPLLTANKVPGCIHPLCGCVSTADCKADPMNTPLPCDVQVEPNLDHLYIQIGKAMVEMTTTVHGPDEWLAIPELWRRCMEERDQLRAAAGVTASSPQTKPPKDSHD